MPHFKNIATALTKELIALFVIFLSNAFNVVGQSYFVNDIVQNIKPTKLFQTKIVNNPKVVFIEKEFTLTVNKTVLINALKVEAQRSRKDFENFYKIVIGYVSSTDRLAFEYLWTKAEAFDGITWVEAEKLGARDLTKCS